MATVRAGQELLSADFLSQLERLSLLSRRSFRGRVKGERRSPRKGISVEFSDFRCPYCKAVVPTLKQLAGQYSDRVRWVFRDFPIPVSYTHLTLPTIYSV